MWLFRRRETLNEQLLREAQLDGPRQRIPTEARLDSETNEPSSRYRRRTLATGRTLAAVVLGGAILAADVSKWGLVAVGVALAIAVGVDVLPDLLDRIRNPNGRY